MVTVQGGEKQENEYRLDSAQAAHSQTFHFAPGVQGNSVRFQVKALEGEGKNLLGGHLALYGHKRREEKQLVGEMNSKQTPEEQVVGSQEDYFCEDYPIYL